MTKALVHFDRNGFGYTLNRETGELLVAEKFDPAVNWATHRGHGDRAVRAVVALLDPGQRRGRQHHQRLPGSARHQRPATGGVLSPKTGLFYVPTNHVCMDYEPYQVSLHRRSALRGATVAMFPAPGGTAISATSSPGMPARARSSGRCPSRSRSGRGALATAGDVVFYGTLEGYLKAVDANTGRSSTASRRRPASSATSTPGCTTASSMWACCPASAVGRASASRPA